MFETRKSALLAALTLAALAWASSPVEAEAFCGMYVSGGDSGTLYNNATQVTLMREGDRTVLSMRNNYQGPPKDFAMVVPVPVVLKEDEVKTLPDAVFQKIDVLAAPRLVEYWEQDPCPRYRPRPMRRRSRALKSAGAAPMAEADVDAAEPQVVIEAEFKKGEYDIVILSAKESNALERWLHQNNYNIPQGATKMLRGYIQQGMYFFVARVDVDRVKFQDGQAMLSPLRFHYPSKDFQLPVRLGLLNAKGEQDLIVHVLSRDGRYEVANMKNATIPTNLVVDKQVKGNFGSFYAALFDDTIKRSQNAVITEYAWESTKCDPCPSGNFGGNFMGGPLNYNDLTLLGLDVVSPAPKRYQFSLGEQSMLKAGDNTRAYQKMREIVNAYAARCATRELDPSQPARGNLKVDLTLPTSGKLEVNIQPMQQAQQIEPMVKCIEGRLGRIKQGYLKRLAGGESMQMESTVSVYHYAYVQNQWQMSQGWTLTRLHARYGADDLDDDLVFSAVDPIVGGRGMPQGRKGKLSEQEAQKSSMNNFQGRYVILHPWNKKTTCKNPSFGRWGYPPGGNSRAQPAQDLAFVKRDKIKLQKVVRSRDVPGLPWTK